jgi:hypothetical protein
LQAQAIMLLAGSGNAWSSNRINLPGRGATAQLFSGPNPQLGPSTSVPPVAQAATAAMTGLSWPVLPKLAANVIPRSPIAKTVDVGKFPCLPKVHKLVFLDCSCYSILRGLLMSTKCDI